MAAVTFKEYALQDGNTLEATQIMLESRVVTAFPLNDQEILCRHLHKVAAEWVDRLHARARGGCPMTDALLPAEFSASEPFAEKWCLPTERQRYAQRLASTMDEMQAFYDAFHPRGEEAIAYCEQVPARRHARPTRSDLLQLLYSLVMVSFPVEAWRQPNVPDSGAAYLDLLIEPRP